MKTYNLIYSSEKQLDDFITENNFSSKQNLLIQVFCGLIDYNSIDNIRELLNTKLPKSQIIGTTTAGEIIGNKSLTDSIVITFTEFYKTKVKTKCAKIESGKEHEQALELAQSLYAVDTKLFLLFTDSLKINGEDIFRGVVDLNEKVFVVGGESGDNYEFKSSYVFDNEKVIENGTVLASLSGYDLNIYTDYNFDWITVGKYLTVTKAYGNVLYEIDNIPVRDVYRSYLGSKVEQMLPGAGIEFPIVISKKGLKIARVVLQVNKDKSISLSGNIKTGDIVQFGFGHKLEIFNSAYKIFNRVKKYPSESIFVYSCCARKKYLGDEIYKEYASLDNIAPVAGFFTYGEFFHNGHQAEFMNETMTILSLSESDEIKNLPDMINSQQGEIYDSTVYALTHLIKTTSEELSSANILLKNRIDDTLKEINESKERYRAIVEDQTELICRYLPDGTMTFVNKAYCRFFRKSADEILGTMYSPDIPDEDLIVINKKNYSLTKQNPVEIIEHRVILENGEIRWLQWTDHAIFDKNGEISEYQSVGRDITEKKLMQEKIEKSKDEYFRFYKTIVDNMNEIVWIGDKNKLTLYANPKYRHVTGFTLEEIKGIDFYTLWDEEIVRKVQKINSKLNMTKYYQGEGAIIGKNGKIIPVFMNKVPFIDGGMAIIMTDLREIKKIQKRAEHLKEVNALKNEFVSIVSHELRTPMTSIKGYLSMILDGDYGAINSELKQPIDTIFNSTERLINMINDMLDLSKMDAGKMVFNKELFGLKGLIEEIYKEYLNTANQKNLNFVIDGNGSDIVLNTDRDKFRQIVINLVSNAFKYTPSGGTVTIKWRKSDDGIMTLWVMDTGIGIDQKDFKKVFGKFQQVHSHLVRQHQGSGLGIPITQKLLKKMGGKLYLESELGKGSNFYFSLPVYNPND